MIDLRAVQNVADLGGSVRKLAVEELVPLAEEFGERPQVCRPLVRAVAAAGLYQVLVVGSEAPWISANRWTAHSVIREALALEDSQCEEVYTIQGLGMYPIALLGDDAQRERYLRPVLNGELLSAFALTEPDAGSDTGRLATTVVRREDGWVLNGTKTFISHAPDADVYVVFARDDQAGGVSAVLVEKGTPGFELEPSMDVLAPHAIGTLHFAECVVPADSILGEPGRGLRAALKSLELFRPSVGARAVGLSRQAFDLATAWTRERTVFGKPLIEHQATQFALAEMAVRIQAARSVVYASARQADQGGDVRFQGSAAKAFATETAQWVVYQAQQLFGGRGVVVGHPLERLYRQVRAMTLYEGTSEIQRVIVGREITKGAVGAAWEF